VTHSRPDLVGYIALEGGIALTPQERCNIVCETRVEKNQTKPTGTAKKIEYMMKQHIWDTD